MFDKLACEIFPHKNLFIVKSSARVSYQDIIDHVGFVMNDELFEVGMNAIYDFTELYSITCDPEILKQTAAAMNDINVIDKRAKTAILLANDSFEVQDVFSQYVELTQPSLIDYRLFLNSEISNLLKFLEIDEIPLFSILLT